MNQYTKHQSNDIYGGVNGNPNDFSPALRVQWPINNNSSGIYADKYIFKYPLSDSISCCIQMERSAPLMPRSHNLFQ